MSSKDHKAQKAVLIASLVILMIALGTSVIAILSPSWQVVDLREFRVEHHHGLWQDCTRPNRRSNLLSTESHQELQYSALSCTYKFDRDAREIIDENLLDIDQNGAAIEAQHHQFFGWQKAVLICFIVLFASSALALLCGTCAPCSNMIAVCFTLFIFIAFANAIFFFAAHRVDSRFVQGLIGTYEQEIGSAFYLSITSTSLLLFSFLLALISTYYLVRNSNKVLLRELTPLYNSSMRHTVI
ncbi:unnamed protein product [Thelazia callipaeda]|uniref:Clc-like protein n=1 Tax=Thelazia callipaeda TaxID=103827 RepID=A0A0N5CLE7_THECL|nr:unnamed protein product [Thelazia callipaeda]